MDTTEDSIHWRRSSRCETGACVEMARIGGTIAIRDSKDVAGPVLIFSAEEWAAFLAGARNGEFD
jgi:Domain of unknown function (DUF397)